MLQFSDLNKIELRKLLTANLTFMEAPKKRYKTNYRDHFFLLPDILHLESKDHSASYKQTFISTAGPHG